MAVLMVCWFRIKYFILNVLQQTSWKLIGQPNVALVKMLVDFKCQLYSESV